MPVTLDDSEVRDALSDMVQAAQGAPLTEEMEQCRDLVHQQYEDEFNTESGPEGEPWTPWHFTREPGFDHPTLFVSGTLKASYTQQAEGHVENIGPREMQTGSDLPYAWIHDEGATIVLGVTLFPRGGGPPARPGSIINIPQRRVAGFSETTLDACTDVVADGLTKRLANG